MKSHIDVYNFDSLRPLLNEISNQPLPSRKKKLSLRGWATRLGYKSPRSIGMVFCGQRLPSALMVNQLGRLLKLDSDQIDYFQALLRVEKLVAAGLPADDIKSYLKSKSPKIQNEEFLSLAQFEYIAEWQHLVIKQLLNQQTENSPEKISKRLKNKIDQNQVMLTLKNLENLGFIKYNPVTNRYQVKKNSLSTTNDIPSLAIRKHHAQMMSRAIEALNEEVVENREMVSATLSFNRNKMNEVKQLIREFRDRLEKNYEDKSATDVFQLNIQFFSHTTECDN